MHYRPDGGCDVPDILIHQNVPLSEVNITNILASDHLPIMFSTLDPVRKKETLDPRLLNEPNTDHFSFAHLRMEADPASDASHNLNIPWTTESVNVVNL
jgi:hypothetical protein